MSRPRSRTRQGSAHRCWTAKFEALELRAMLDGGAGGGAQPLLPDLIAVADEDQGYVYDWSVNAVTGGRTLLRLSTATANIGDGPLELRGGASHPDGTQDVVQRIYQDDGTHVDQLAGEFIFHPEHDHIHFEGYAEYNLRAMTEDGGVGDVVATGGKTSFCVIDLDEYDLSLPGSPNQAEYDACGVIQGLSVGWEDIYDRSLPDQWIDVTGVPEGPYWLEVVADPDNHIAELDDTNNTVRIPIDLTAPEPLVPDAYEPNDTRANAADLGTGALQIEGLSIHAEGDDDWFAWTAAAAGDVTIETHFRHADGDIDLFIYDATGRFLDSSEDVENVESVTVSLEAGEKLFIQVIGYEDAVNPDYSLTIADGASPVITPDDFEPNNSLSFPTHLEPEAQVLPGLSLHTSTDEDYFRWTAPAGGTLHISAGVASAVGDVDLFLFNMLREEIAASTDGDVFEEITLENVQPGALLYFGVRGGQLGAVADYTFSVEFTPALTGDANGDGQVDLEDLNLVRNNFGGAGNHIPGDTDHDGDVDLADLNAVRNNFGALLPASPSPLRTVQMPAKRMDSAVDLLATISTTPGPKRASKFMASPWLTP